MSYTRHSLRQSSEGSGARLECVELRHPPITFNPLLGVTFCGCGRITRPGNQAIALTDRQRCERARSRRDHRLVCPIHSRES